MRRATRILMLAAAGLLLTAAAATAQVPTNMNVQGRLTDGAGDPVAPGLKIFTFKIYDAEIGGTEVWPAAPGEQQTLLTGDNGLWNAAVGTAIPLTEAVFQDTSRWLEVTVDDGVNPPETLSRVKLNTYPFTYRSASSQHADSAGHAQASDVTATAQNAQNLGGQPPSAYASSSHGHTPAAISPQGAGSSLDADFLDGQHASAFAGSGHNHDAAYVNEVGDTMTGGLTLPIAYLGDANVWNGALKLFQVGSPQPLVYMYPYSGGRGGAIDIRDEAGNYTINLEPDATGRGGYFQVYGGKSASAFMINGMTSAIDSNLTLIITGSGSGTTFNTNLSGNNSVQLPSDAVSASEILDEPGIASNNSNASVSITGMTTMQDVISVSITIPSAGYVFVSSECYAILNNTLSYNRVIADISELSGGTGSSPWIIVVGNNDYGSIAGSQFVVNPKRVYYKTAGTYTFKLRARHFGSGSGQAVLWYPKIFAQYIPTAYGSVATVASAGDAAGFEQATLAESAGGDDGSGVAAREPMYRVDLRELEIRALKARVEAEQLERELAEARMTAQQSARGEGGDVKQ